ncbi:DNA/RNA nuclease SfsA [Parvibaculum lavamentivorans]|nr:DNA/RNA nuclease SfsA [Parvibaculum lavamentivorans]
MKFSPPLIQATLLKRYKRFLADVRFDDGSETTAHCANPGSMMGLSTPGSTVWLSKSDNPKRKLAWSWELIEVSETLVGVHTGRPNALVAAAINAGEIPELIGYETARREVKYGQNSRIDILLEKVGTPSAYVEIKSVTLSRTPGLAEFPDSKTSRGAKHMNELAEMAKSGHRAVVFFLVQRSDCTRMCPAADIDPVYAQSLVDAVAAGVEVICYSCKITSEGIDLDGPLDVSLSNSPNTA